MNIYNIKIALTYIGTEEEKDKVIKDILKIGGKNARYVTPEEV